MHLRRLPTAFVTPEPSTRASCAIWRHWSLFIFLRCCNVAVRVESYIQALKVVNRHCTKPTSIPTVGRREKGEQTAQARANAWLRQGKPHLFPLIGTKRCFFRVAASLVPPSLTLPELIPPRLRYRAAARCGQAPVLSRFPSCLDIQQRCL